MVTLDWIFLGVLLLSMLVGAWRGLVVEVLSLANWAVAFVAAQWFAPALAAQLPMGGATDLIRYGAAFVLVFVGAVFAGSILIWLTGKLFQAAGLRPADRALGGVFGVLRGLILLLALAALVALTPMKSEPWWTQSSAAGWATAAARGLKPVLPRELGGYLP